MEVVELMWYSDIYGKGEECVERILNEGWEVIDYKYDGNNRFYTLRRGDSIAKLYWIKVFKDFKEYVVVYKKEVR